METQTRYVLSCLILVALVSAFSVEAFNQDRTIHKWSPQWFNSYYRRGNLFKRFRDEPIEKWSPNYFDNDFAYYYDKRDVSGCGRENSLCISVGEFSGRIMSVKCCGSLQCRFNGQTYTCTDPKTAELDESGFVDSAY